MEKDSLYKFLYRFFDLIVLTYFVFSFGYSVKTDYQIPKLVGLLVIVLGLLAFNTAKFFYYKSRGRKKVALAQIILLGVLLIVSGVVSLVHYQEDFHFILRKIRPILEAGIVLYFFIRLMVFVRYIYQVYYNPAIVFVGSFFTIILLGSFLLMLPNATTNGITFTDALFTATSAVCVTGLVVLDTANDFTQIGQTIILVLFQLGGLGILTFTSFFSYFFRGSSSFKEGLNIKDFIAQENIKDVLKIALNVVVFTLFVEMIGAGLIYSTIQHLDEIEDKIFFSVFHSISAFCNAGFSTMSSGLSEEFLKFNYTMQWVVMVLIVLGGLGFNIISNYYTYLKTLALELFDKTRIHKQIHITTLNTRIVLYTTLALIVGGFVFLAISEYQNTLLIHDTWFGKVTTSFFNAITPRTAGFNTMDFSQYTVPSLLFIIFLMWIGASPGSTGGGIKTSTFALATLNIIATARGKSRIQLQGRRISSESTARAFAILCISLIVIGFAILALLIFEPKGTDLLSVVFECFSAYSTVGLSLNLTPTLTEPSKVVLIFTMFIGRIGLLNLLFGMLRELNHQFYEYPKENILIN